MPLGTARRRVRARRCQPRRRAPCPAAAQVHPAVCKPEQYHVPVVPPVASRGHHPGNGGQGGTSTRTPPCLAPSTSARLTTRGMGPPCRLPPRLPARAGRRTIVTTPPPSSPLAVRGMQAYVQPQPFMDTGKLCTPKVRPPASLAGLPAALHAGGAPPRQRAALRWPPPQRRSHTLPNDPPPPRCSSSPCTTSPTCSSPWPSCTRPST